VDTDDLNPAGKSASIEMLSQRGCSELFRAAEQFLVGLVGFETFKAHHDSF